MTHCLLTGGGAESILTVDGAMAVARGGGRTIEAAATAGGGTAAGATVCRGVPDADRDSDAPVMLTAPAATATFGFPPTIETAAAVCTVVGDTRAAEPVIATLLATTTADGATVTAFAATATVAAGAEAAAVAGAAAVKPSCVLC